MDLLNKIKVPLVSEIPFKDLKLDRFLGRGAFGHVYKGKYREHVDVAIKEMPTYSVSTSELAKEISVLTKLHHETLITLLGVASTRSHVYLVMDLVDGQSLFKILFDDSVKKNYDFTEKERFTIGYDITMAMVYLHTCEIVHRDRKSGNVVVDFNTKRAKMCDFGLAKDFNRDAILETVGHVGCIGTKPYTAPEVYFFRKPSSKKSDVWSLGCTLLELFTEEFVWNIEKPSEVDEVLKKAYKQCELPPRLYFAPTFLVPALKGSFNYDCEEWLESHEIKHTFEQEKKVQKYRQETKKKYEKSAQDVGSPMRKINKESNSVVDLTVEENPHHTSGNDVISVIHSQNNGESTKATEQSNIFAEEGRTLKSETSEALCKSKNQIITKTSKADLFEKSFASQDPRFDMSLKSRLKNMMDSFL
ncbi:hypothetical protein QAD02_011321 [Eretmocerus hayati]|uniref:Uncharacterized protein n=1 Tax=Eretmocerus hayati TaxID=131215 RepID=A0ACC2NW62_9HYME|nr:hypothetical protein QAD02_011321 [Eretmocerus hayati]